MDRSLEETLLKQFALTEDRKLKQLSRGVLMKAALLSALSYRPKLLVLDEPFSGLDPLVRDEFIHGVLEVSAVGDWTVVVSSHDIEVVERLADHVAMLEEGRLRLSETTAALLGRFRRVEVSGEELSGGAMPGVLGWERAGGLTRFVVTDYAGEASERRWHERYAGAAVSFRPMALREIFVTLARARQGSKEEVAA